ncbi:MAG: DoxX family protein [Actinomycetota bacterium]|nr:DoxX family protein [Actinomycetota bacterium]
MSALSLSSMGRFADFAPLVARVIVGIIMFAHGLQKLLGGPANFGGALAGMGVPLPVLTAFVVTLVEVVCGLLLIIGLLSRLSALLLTIDLVVAILLVKVSVGLIAPQGTPGAGAELDLALIAGLLVVLFAGPGRLSADHALGIEPGVVAEEPSSRRGRRVGTT